MKDKAFAERIFALDEPEDVQQAFSDEGVDLSLQEVEQLGEMIRKVCDGEISEEQLEKAANGELDEDELEQVSGGVIAELVLMAGVGIFATMMSLRINTGKIHRLFRR